MQIRKIKRKTIFSHTFSIVRKYFCIQNRHYFVGNSSIYAVIKKMLKRQQNSNSNSNTNTIDSFGCTHVAKIWRI